MRTLKRMLSAMLSACLAVTGFALCASAVNEPTTEELERMIKIVKPRLDVPEDYTEFTWNYNAKSTYSDESWNFTWRSREKGGRVNVRSDKDGHITYYYLSDPDTKYGLLPAFTRTELCETAKAFMKKTLPAADDLVLTASPAAGSYSNGFNYTFTRAIDGRLFNDNSVNITVDFNTGKVESMNVNYDYDIDVKRPAQIITPEKAAELLGSRQKMELVYITKVDYDKDTDTRTIKAVLVYKPAVSYLAVDAETGEIYDTKSEWQVARASGAMENGKAKMMYADAAAEESAVADYSLTEEELAGVAELDALISKEQAIKAVTENEALYFDKSLTGVSADLTKNRNFLKSAAYQNDNGSYVWNISFSNPVFDGKYYSNAYAYATVNADTGELISYDSNLNDYWYYTENKLELPKVQYDKEACRVIGETFLKNTVPGKFENTVYESSYDANIIDRKLLENGREEYSYGAFGYNYVRVNEGIKYNQNTISVTVDGVSGKIAHFSTNWYTNIEFESPKGAMTPEKALECLLSFDGYGLNYERNITYIYKPLTEGSKQSVAAAFVASLTSTAEGGGDIELIIKKYAADIDREKLNALLAAGDEEELKLFAYDYFGVTGEEIGDVYEYVDSSLMYDKKSGARLVYSCYAQDTQFVSPFTGKQLNYDGTEYVKVNTEYTYDDIAGHWAEGIISKLSDIGVGFEGGKFEPEKKVSADDFKRLAEGLGMYSALDAGYTEGELMRIGAIRYVVKSLGYQKVAELPDIYRTDFVDNDEIKKEDLGYTAIAKALGIVSGSGSKIRVYDGMTRAEAVCILVNAKAAQAQY